MLSEFDDILSTAVAFKTNLLKDSQSRRSNLELLSKKTRELDRIEEIFKRLELNFKSELGKSINSKEILICIQSINTNIEDCRSILLERRGNIELSRLSTSSTMAERFELKTATSLLPVMTDSEIVTNQLIDAIDLYASMLDEAGKGLLIQYVLKTRLSPSAKLRLNSTYNTVGDLIRDMRTHLLSSKSAAALSIELHNIKQNNKTIDDYGKEIEELLVNLTIAQSDGDAEVSSILRKTNERTAVVTFANGLRNSELRTIIKARNYNALKDAIAGAKDEQKTKGSDNSNVFYYRQNYNSARGNRRNFRGNFDHRGSRSNFQSNNNFQSRNMNQQPDFNRRRGQNFPRYNTRGFRGRGGQRHHSQQNLNQGNRQDLRNNGQSRAYIAHSEFGNTDFAHTTENAEQQNSIRFFRE